MATSLVKDYLQLMYRFVSDVMTGLESGFQGTDKASYLPVIQGKVLNIFSDAISSTEKGSATNAQTAVENANNAYLKLLLTSSTKEELDAAWATYQASITRLESSLPPIPPFYAKLQQTLQIERDFVQVYVSQTIGLEKAVASLDRWIAVIGDYQAQNIAAWEQIRNSEITLQQQGQSRYATSNKTMAGYIQDGNYGREVNRISPEGFIYGAQSWIRDFIHYYWWDGAKWIEIPDTIGQSNSVTLLPSGPQDPNTVWRCVDSLDSQGNTVWIYFFWNAETQEWTNISWHWTIEGGYRNLPSVGFKLGEGHKVIEPDVELMWDGAAWRRTRISSLDDDLGILNTVELYGETLSSLSPSVELIFMSPTELSLRPVNSDFDYTTVNGMTIDSSKRVSVYSFSPVLDWWGETESFSTSLLQHSTDETPEEYYVYLANKNDCFNVNTYDYRGRLFCSKTVHTNSRLGKFGTSAYNAIYIGRCQTAVPSNPLDRVEFLNELDVSAISRVADLKETFREFSDFDLIYIDEETLQLKRTNGTAGQIFVGGRLYFLGESINLDIADARITVDGNGLVAFDYDEIAADEYYFVYLAPDSDIYNDNELNPAANKPWHPEDTGAGNGVTGPYYANKDLRLKMFLSTKTPEESRLGETWQTYWCRHIGQVETDAVKKLKYSASISSLRQMVLNPTFFDGLAEIMLQPVSTSEFRIIKAAGTSGICIVGGNGVQTYETTSTSPMVHAVLRTDKVYTYTGSQTTPLVDSGTYLYQYTTTFAYLYLTNDNAVWGSVFAEQGRARNSRTGCLILCTNPAADAYLAKSFPGNTARWICTIGMDSSGYFSGGFIAENLKQPGGNSAVPTGTILDFAGPTCPNGFLVCDGTYYYPAQYPNLWAAIGGYWGWDGSRFAVPNLSYACTIGTGYWGLGSRLGKTNITVNDMPAHQHYQDHQHYVGHNHSFSIPEHYHNHDHGGYTGNIYYKSGTNPSYWYADDVYSVGADGVGFTNSRHHRHSISNDSAPMSAANGGTTSAAENGLSSAMNQYAYGSLVGGSASDGNMQPSAVVLKIIRY